MQVGCSKQNPSHSDPPPAPARPVAMAMVLEVSHAGEEVAAPFWNQRRGAILAVSLEQFRPPANCPEPL